MKVWFFVFVLLLSGSIIASAQAQQYSNLGRDPMIPGGVTPDRALELGWEPFQIPEDLTCMMQGGSSSEWKRARLPKGTWAAICPPDGRVRLLECGNITNIKAFVIVKRRQKPAPPPPKSPPPPPPPRVEIKYREIIREIPVYVPVLVREERGQYVAALPPPAVVVQQFSLPPIVVGGTAAAGGGGGGGGGGAAAAAAAAASAAASGRK